MGRKKIFPGPASISGAPPSAPGPSWRIPARFDRAYGVSPAAIECTDSGALIPIRSRIGTDGAADGAGHARAEPWHLRFVGVVVNNQHGAMPALQAATCHAEAADAISAHIT